MRKIEYCSNPCEDDDCGGYCLGRDCKSCKYLAIIMVGDDE